MLTGLIGILITILIIGLILGLIVWAIGLIPMPPVFKQVTYAVVGIIVLVMALEWLTGGLGTLRLG